MKYENRQGQNLGSKAPTWINLNPLSWQSVRLVIERLLTPGSIPELAMRRFVFRKEILFFHWRPSSYVGKTAYISSHFIFLHSKTSAVSILYFTK